MKRSLLRFALPFMILLIIPFVYNSCQGHLLGGAMGSASLASSCKVTLENKQLRELRFDPKAIPAAFARSKVQLKSDNNVTAAGANAKATADTVNVDSGTKLGILMDNQCLQENAQALDNTVISKAVTKSGGMMPELDRQIYLWELDRNYIDSEIETLANREDCVVGISWNKEYKLQAFNDSSYIYQTHLAAMHAEQAYSQFYTAPGAMALTGTPVILATVDTGVDWSHPDLQSNMWSHSKGVGIDITTLGTTNIDYNPYDISSIGHGTHVSGIMAAVSNNAVGIVGTMPYRAKIMGVKIFKADTSGNISTTSQYFYNGIKFAYLNGANVINLSVGSVTAGVASDTLAQTGLNEAVQNGTVVVVVIGNADGNANGQVIDGTTMSSIPGQYASIPGVIGVGSFDSQSGDKSAFSHYSTTYAEIGAPGAESGTTGIYSTLPVALSSYGRLEGTSQAAPMVSAAAGLTIGLIREAYGVIPSPAEVERLILASAIKSPQLTSYFKDGNRLDLLNLVQRIQRDYPLTAAGNPAALSSQCR